MTTITAPRPVTTRALRIGVIAPPWVAVPPASYGGTELILDVLARGLQQLGHDVTLFTVGESTCAVPKASLFTHADPDRMGSAVLELRHVAAAYDLFEDCDLVHDHTLVGLFVSQLHHGIPVVTTNHGPFNDDLVDLYRRTVHRVPLVAISHHQASTAPVSIPIARVIHHGIDENRYRFEPRQGEGLVFVGRMNPDKGIDVAIGVARRIGMPLRIAAKMREPNEYRYFRDVIKPLLGGDIEFVGEVDHAGKVELLSTALALVNPIQWAEPFGLTMVEAMACGTPVVATPRGAAPEIIEHGRTGYLAATVPELAEAVEAVAGIDRARCRRRVEAAFSMHRMARAHEELYQALVAGRPLQERRTGAYRSAHLAGGAI